METDLHLLFISLACQKFIWHFFNLLADLDRDAGSDKTRPAFVLSSSAELEYHVRVDFCIWKLDDIAYSEMEHFIDRNRDFAKLCHNQSGLHCPVTLAACGYIHPCPCDPSTCVFKRDDVKGICKNSSVAP